jgi:non-specific serine/threonine protein kinase
LRLARTSGETAAVLRALINLGIIARFRCAHEEAVIRLEEALQVSRSAGDGDFESHALSNLALVELARRRPDRAVPHLTASLRLARARHDAWATGLALYRLGVSFHDQGDPGAAAAHLAEGVALSPEHGDESVAAETLDNLAFVARSLGRIETAGLLLGAADARRQSSGMPTFPDWRMRREEALAAMKAELSGSDFAALWEAGRQLSDEQLLYEVDELARCAATRSTPLPSRPLPHRPAVRPPLSPRELEVLTLLVAGLTDQEIADALYIARRTVTTHVSAILAKLEVHSRTAAVARATREGWV